MVTQVRGGSPPLAQALSWGRQGDPEGGTPDREKCLVERVQEAFTDLLRHVCPTWGMVTQARGGSPPLAQALSWGRQGDPEGGTPDREKCLVERVQEAFTDLLRHVCPTWGMVTQVRGGHLPPLPRPYPGGGRGTLKGGTPDLSWVAEESWCRPGKCKKIACNSAEFLYERSGSCGTWCVGVRNGTPDDRVSLELRRTERNRRNREKCKKIACNSAEFLYEKRCVFE